MRKVLVIDDEKATLNMFRLFLTAYGYTVFLAENGSAGLEIFEKERPPIVFTDVKMPGMDGFEVLKRLKEIAPKTEIIIITGHGDMDLVLKALHLEATDFINKPIQRTALESALARAEWRIKSGGFQQTRVSSRVRDDATILYIEGDVNAQSGTVLAEVCKDAKGKGARKMVLHFDENSRINSDGIAILNRMIEDCKKENRKVAVTGISETLKNVFSMVGISRMARTYSSEEEAVDSFEQNG